MYRSRNYGRETCKLIQSKYKYIVNTCNLTEPNIVKLLSFVKRYAVENADCEVLKSLSVEYAILFYGLNAYSISKEETTKKCLTNPLSVKKRIFMVTISCMKSIDGKVHKCWILTVFHSPHFLPCLNF